MSAIVCGKRSFFEDLQTSPTSASSPVAKRLRWSSSTSPARFSTSPHSAPPLIDQLHAFFPDMNKQLLERALEECGNDLDSAIKSLNELCLVYTKGDSESNANIGEDGDNVLPPKDGLAENNGIPLNGSEWVELFVREMMSSASIDDARSQAARILESLEKSITERSCAESANGFLKENMILKEQIEALLRENTILKRAVAIQHERQKEHDDRNQEVQNLKQMVSQYQEQLRTLEVNNYTLLMHLRAAQESNSIPGSFHRHIF